MSLAKWIAVINRAHEYGHDLTPSERRDLAVDLLAADTRCAALTARLWELAIEGHQGGWGDHIKHDFATCPEPSCVADRALIGEGA